MTERYYNELFWLYYLASFQNYDVVLYTDLTYSASYARPLSAFEECLRIFLEQWRIVREGGRSPTVLKQGESIDEIVKKLNKCWVTEVEIQSVIELFIYRIVMFV